MKDHLITKIPPLESSMSLIGVTDSFDFQLNRQDSIWQTVKTSKTKLFQRDLLECFLQNFERLLHLSQQQYILLRWQSKIFY